MKINEEVLTSVEKRSRIRICVVEYKGAGLTTACLLANAGFKVVVVDKDRGVVETVKKGESPFSEPSLQELVYKNVKERKLNATVDIKGAVSKSDVIIVAINIPVDEKMRPDYSRLETTCKEIGKDLRRDSLVVITNTVGPGVTENLVKSWIEDASGLKAGRDFGLAYSPTLAAAEKAPYDISNYARLIAGIDNESLKAASLLFKTIINSKIIPLSSIKAAETAKIFQNVYRDVNLALSNELALFCERLGIDYMEVYKAANTDPYCHFLLPGIVSGHIPKDPYLLLKEAEDLGVKLRIAKLARKVNESMVDHTVKLIRKALRRHSKPLRGAKIAVLGVSYKANVKEPKGSRTLKLVKLLQLKGAKVKVHDPFFNKKELSELGYPAENSLEKTIKGADCLVIVVGHNQFKKLSLKRIKALMRHPAIVDLSHIINPKEAEKEKVTLISLGRG